MDIEYKNTIRSEIIFYKHSFDYFMSLDDRLIRERPIFLNRFNNFVRRLKKDLQSEDLILKFINELAYLNVFQVQTNFINYLVNENPHYKTYKFQVQDSELHIHIKNMQALIQFWTLERSMAHEYLCLQVSNFRRTQRLLMAMFRNVHDVETQFQKLRTHLLISLLMMITIPHDATEPFSSFTIPPEVMLNTLGVII